MDIIKEIQELNKEMLGDKEYTKYVDSIFKEILETPTNEEKIRELKIFLDEIDKRRNSNWSEVFPWLINI